MRDLIEENLGIAVVDDDAIFRELICLSVAKKSRFSLFQAGSESDLRDLLTTQHIDCIVLDYHLGSDNGLAVKYRMDQAFPELSPTIMMTGDGRESTAIRAFRMGVGDYLPKRGLRPEDVVGSIVRVVSQARERAVVNDQHRRLIEAASLDVVTGLEGRARLDERLAHLASLKPAARSLYAIVEVQCVEHRDIAERFGLKVADQVLRAFGKRLQGLTRSNDVCGRYAGGTFIIITNVTPNSHELTGLCERLTAGLNQRFSTATVELMLTAHVTAMVDLEDRSRPDASGSSVEAGPVSFPREFPDRAGTSGPAAPSASEAAPAAEALRTSDRRFAQRQRIFKRGLIHLLGPGGTINCNVRNVSATGVGLRIESPFGIPAEFNLEIVGSGERRRARLQWQNAVDVGVAFVVDPSP